MNTAAAERLCTLLRSQCGLTRASVLLDVCCGAGMIGLTMAPAVRRARGVPMCEPLSLPLSLSPSPRAGQVRHVWGVEMCAPAVVDARRNAARNGVANASFVTGRAEDKIESVLRALSAEDKEHLVAVVDPPRAGLHDSVLKTLRACAELKRMLYVSCHAPSFVKNAVMLCKPPTNAVKGVPFQPARTLPLEPTYPRPFTLTLSLPLPLPLPLPLTRCAPSRSTSSLTRSTASSSSSSSAPTRGRRRRRPPRRRPPRRSPRHSPRRRLTGAQLGWQTTARWVRVNSEAGAA